MKTTEQEYEELQERICDLAQNGQGNFIADASILGRFLELEQIMTGEIDETIDQSFRRSGCDNPNFLSVQYRLYHGMRGNAELRNRGTS